MEKGIVVLDADQKQCQDLCLDLEKNRYTASPIYSIENLVERLNETDYLAVIVDIDTIAIDNRTVRELTIKYPGVYFFCLSKDRFHPELKDAICYHIYACLKKPVDLDELFYWLRSIYENEADPRTESET
jgi:DNA-binding NtrC family response regulator